MSPLVSIHCPTYNHERFVGRAISSALQQSYRNIELCISDDCSTDGTKEEIEKYRKQSPGSIKIHYQSRNVGMVENLNAALDMCEGKYICFLTGDDYYHPKKIQLQVELMESDPELVITGHYVHVVDTDDNRIRNIRNWRITGKGPRQWIEHGAVFPALSVMVRRDSIPRGGFDKRIPVVNDLKFWVDCLANGGRYRQIREFLGAYRKTPSGVTADVLHCLNQVQFYLEVLIESYPQYTDSCKRAMANLDMYGRGIYYSSNGDFRESNRYHIQAFRSNPRNLKPLVRIVQNIMLQNLKRASNERDR